MNTIITAEFDSFEYADKAISRIHSISPKIQCVESCADNRRALDTPPFVVPIAPDYFRIFPAFHNNKNMEETEKCAQLNIVANSRYDDDIEKIIRRYRGKIESKAYRSQ